MSRYAFDDVRAALHKHWGLSLHRGGDLTELERDGRWSRARAGWRPLASAGIRARNKSQLWVSCVPSLECRASSARTACTRAAAGDASTGGNDASA